MTMELFYLDPDGQDTLSGVSLKESQGSSQGNFQGLSQEISQGLSQGLSQGNSQELSQGSSQGNSQGSSQGKNPGKGANLTEDCIQEKEEIVKGKSGKMNAKSLQYLIKKPWVIYGVTGIVLTVSILGNILGGKKSEPVADAKPPASVMMIASEDQAEAANPLTEGEKDLATAILEGKDATLKSIDLSNDHLVSSMANLYLSQMRMENAKTGMTPQKWWLNKAQEVNQRMMTRLAERGDFSSYEGISNWATWLLEMQGLIRVYDQLRLSGDGQSIQTVPMPPLRETVLSMRALIVQVVAGDTAVMEQMSVIGTGLDKSLKDHKQSEESLKDSMNEGIPVKPESTKAKK